MIQRQHSPNIHVQYNYDTLFRKAWNYRLHIKMKQSFIRWWVAHFHQFLNQFDCYLFVVFVCTLNVNFNYSSEINSVFPLFAFIYIFFHDWIPHTFLFSIIDHCETVKWQTICTFFFRLIKFEWFSKVNTKTHKIMN